MQKNKRIKQKKERNRCFFYEKNKINSDRGIGVNLSVGNEYIFTGSNAYT